MLVSSMYYDRLKNPAVMKMKATITASDKREQASTITKQQ